LSFQEDDSRDVFNTLREKIRLPQHRIRQGKSDHLFYMLIDLIVDHYYLVMEKLSEKIELLEEEIIRNANKRSLARINQLRKEMIVLKRNIGPTRELVNGILRSESPLLQERTEKYFKDVYDHIVQANELAENYRDMMMNLQDLYLSNVNLKMNEVMKVMAVVTCVLAPATVIGGMFGMNFDVIPFAHHGKGFFIEPTIYNEDLFEYEYTILHYYLFPMERLEGIKLSLDYIKSHKSVYSKVVESNLRFYQS
jgi:magnesium transporter